MPAEENENFGYDAFFETNRRKLGLDVFSVARVIAEHKEAYDVINKDGRYSAKITGKQMFDASSREDYPAVGDWVAVTELEAERAVIRGILPRRTIIKRKYSGKNETQVIAANIDVAFVIESVDRDYNLNRFERYFAIARDGGVQPAIILNKTDLISKEELDARLTQLKDRFGDIDVVATSTLANSGLDKLKACMSAGKTYCFLGSSGVGKSSLINKLLGGSVIKTKSISLSTGKGRHTTTNRQMYFLENGAIVIDNPGMREVGMTDAGAGIDDLFGEMTALAKRCKYADCTHVHESGCEILSALRSGKLDEGRYSNYIALRKEADHYEMTELERREKDRQFGKFLKSAKKDIEKYKR